MHSKAPRERGFNGTWDAEKATGAYEWYSPREVVDAALDVLGRIDLDPASCDVANTTVQAAQFYTTDTNGLAQPWRGRV
jgi:hypothetical protein